MTTNAYSPAPTYTISGPGPYDVPHDYGSSDELEVSVIIAGTPQVLDSADYTVVPEGPTTSGTVFLTAGAATLYDGETLQIARDTSVSQSWEGLTSTAQVLEDQLDRLTRGIQENQLAAGTAEAVALAISGGTWKGSALDLLADTALTYTQGLSTTVDPGARIITLKEGFSYEVADSAATDHHLTTAGGIKLYVLPGEDRSIQVAAFGTVGDGVADDSAPIQAFLDTIAATDFGQADMSGTYAIGTTLTFGAPGSEPATKHIRGRVQLTALNPMDEMLLLTDCIFVEWDTLHLIGTGGSGGVAFAARTCKNGLRLQNSASQLFRKITVRNFAFAGVCADSGNNSLIAFGDVKTTDCGSGHANFSLTGTWSNPVNSGTSGSVTQRTVIDVTTMPPDYVINGDYGAVGSSPYMVRIDGRLHYIYGVDQIGGTLTVFPWVASTATPGAFEYVFGGGVFLRGSDCNVNSFSAIDAIRCGTALASASLYGPRADRVVTQFCGAGILVGRGPSDASLGGFYGNIYFENNVEDLILVMRGGDNAYNYFGAEYAINTAKVYCAGAPRQTNDTFSTTYEPFQRQALSLKGETLLYEKASRSATGPTANLTPGRRDQTLVFERDTATFNLLELDADLNRLTGVDSCTLVCLGTGANREPTGTITLTAPPGWTINGGAGPLTVSNLTQAPVFVLQWQIASLDVIVAQVNGAQAAHVADATTGSAAEINALRDALVNAGLMAAS